MKHTIWVYLLNLCSLVVVSCQSNTEAVDATGTFEATEIIVSAEATGKLESFSIEDGDTVTQGELIGVIDTTQLDLRRQQLQAQIGAILTRQPDIAKQIASLQEQLRGAKRERDRVAALVKADAATPKQLDDAGTSVDVLQNQLDAQISALELTTSGMRSDTRPLLLQIDQLADQIYRSKLFAPITGVVLSTYVDRYEFATVGKPLYTVANLSELTLRAYISNSQLTQIKLGKSVTVTVDRGTGSHAYKGTVSWISSKAEFTPKTIQTKDERADLVYAVKIRVVNDGYIKIGMYGEVGF